MYGQVPYRQFTLREGAGRCALSLILIDTGAGIQGVLLGGEKPHIGGIVLGVPRPSLTGEGWGADLFVIPVSGHKDVELASSLAKRLAQELRLTVAISAGVHCERITGQELAEIRKNCERLGDEALRVLSCD